MNLCELSVFDLFARVRNKPALFVGEKSLIRIRAFVDGYIVGAAECKRLPQGLDTFHDFHDWIAKKFNFTAPTSGWCNMILDRTESDAQAFDRFYELLDEFCRERGIPPGDPQKGLQAIN
jgi:hypothetical protein